MASGATFDVNNVQCEISGLRFDCSKVFGTITRFSPATSGVLRLDNVPADAVLAGYSVPFAPDEIVNAENLQKWKVYVNGKRRMFTAKAEGGEIRLIPSGFTVIIR